MQKIVLSCKADEVARNGAHPRIPSLEVLGRPLHFHLTSRPNPAKPASQSQSLFQCARKRTTSVLLTVMHILVNEGRRRHELRLLHHDWRYGQGRATVNSARKRAR